MDARPDEKPSAGQFEALAMPLFDSLSLSSAPAKSRFKIAIEGLPVIFREALLLCEVEEMSYQEIAQTLSIPIGTVMSRLSRARMALRRALKEKVQEAKHG